MRERARKCRDIATAHAKVDDWSKWLLELADELDEEADKIDAVEFRGLRH